MLETAKLASKEIEESWPEWKKQWSKPEQVEIRPDPRVAVRVERKS